MSKKMLIKVMVVISLVSVVLTACSKGKSPTASTGVNEETHITRASATQTKKVTTESIVKNTEEPQPDTTTENESLKSDEGEDFQYEEVNGELTIDDYSGKADKLVIPSEIDGKPVAAIAHGTFQKCSFSEVIIPDSVKTIEREAFMLCKNLQKVTLGKSVETIGDQAFAYNRKLEAINLPDSLKSIGSLAFSGCNSMSEVKLSQGVTVYNNGEFSLTAITNVVIPDGVTELSSQMFGSCEKLKEVQIPASVNKIDTDTFAGCNNLTIVTPAGSYAEKYAKENNINVKSN